MNIHTGRGEGGEKVSVTHPHTHTHTNTHTLHTTHTRQHPHIAHQQHTQRTNAQHTTRKVSSPILLTKICPHVGLAPDPRGSPKNPWILHIFSLRIDREQHVPDSSNHSLYQIKLFNSSSPEGHCGRNQPPDGSICLSPPKPKYNERFTRQTLSMMFGQRSL